MPSITIDKRFRAPADVAFHRCSDFAGAPQHIKSIKRVEMLTQGPVGLGTRFKETRVMFGKEATETMEVLDWQPGRSFTIGGDSCGTKYRMRFDFRQEGAETALNVVVGATATTLLAKLLSPLSFLMMGTMRKCIEADLDQIKTVVEAARPC